ncbi:MAG TPA: Asp-tRNA(Asn)/Glu-tRNA(Gln) amidotransferase subunit GatB [Thermoanaerobaculia bacterium]|jgi:aspartyl-tRNA(Asn)/glutamyl-tRNA(Gln) amidotransferase subunit B|nr:Asp-tRNA(Asn)/Glu-tRNA(Gln) amidotransferase subunit GatB [Thermoanaerobaculia bacterium]
MTHPDYEAVIGLEVHVQLLTGTKMFCRCPNRFGAAPNTLVCPVCLGYPGTLPVPNHQAVDLAVRLALALGFEVRETSVFARKNYFYPDLPKGYQISQFDRPLAENGLVPLAQSDKQVRVERLHLEEDAGKLLHEAPGGGALPGQSLVDFNRCGVPLVEIVSRPDMSSAAEAQDYLQTLHQLLLYTQTSDGNMEEGSLRCDANVSVRRRGETTLGTKAEVKNLNSFRNVARAIEHEIERQIALIESGGRVAQETRSFDAATGATRLMRSKEEAHDYRYFPDPDLPPLVVTAERREAIRAALPELPWQRRARLAAQYGLPAADAQVLTASRELADYYEAAVMASSGRSLPANPKGIANWVQGEVLRDIKERQVELGGTIAPERLAALVAMVDAGKISNSAAKEVFAAVAPTGGDPAAAVERLGLAQVSDSSRIERWIDEVIEQNPAQVAQYRAGKVQIAGFLVGQVMKLSGGRAEPKIVQQLMRQALDRVPMEREPVAGPAE